MTAGYAIDDVGLFAEEELLADRPVLRYPSNLLPAQNAAGTFGVMLGLWRGWRAERFGIERPYTWAELQDLGPSHCWEPAICGPRFDQDASHAANDPGPECAPAILMLDLRCNPWEHEGGSGAGPCLCVGDLLYLHGCTWCGRLDEPRDCENAAVEDAMDHRWPGWRDLPVLASAVPDDTKQRATWLAAANRAYPPGWIETGGPIRTARSRGATRHVPSRHPFGGVDLGVLVADDHHLNHKYSPGLYVPPTTQETNS